MNKISARWLPHLFEKYVEFVTGFLFKRESMKWRQHMEPRPVKVVQSMIMINTWSQCLLHGTNSNFLNRIRQWWAVKWQPYEGVYYRLYPNVELCEYLCGKC